jgi:hypothetical protein
MDERKVYTENKHKYKDVKKFTIPNVKVGSIIEVIYVVESPFFKNFHSWEFQSDIPKIRSEYWATIPGTLIYNITLKGFLTLQKNESEVVKDCYTPGGGMKADCARFKYGMTNIPAFVDEDYMLARSNYLSAINFELSEWKQFNGSTKKYTKEWKDADRDLKQHDDFGVQLKRGEGFFEDQIQPLVAGELDELVKAKRIFDFIKFHYQWNRFYGMYTEFGIKKAFEMKKGNVADINLSLVGALRSGGLNAEPVMLSTRYNGLPIELHPVLTDFDYVIAKVNIGEKSFLLDALDDFTPFGMLPVHCVNGKGRVVGEKESYWIDLKPTDKEKFVSVFTFKLEKDGMIRGKVHITYTGYEAVEQRKYIKSFSTEKEYFDDFRGNSDKMEIAEHELKNLDDISKPLIESYSIEHQLFDNTNERNPIFDPFFAIDKTANPFKSNERLYPVDFGAPIEETVVLTLEYPENFTITDLPEKVALSLPNSGGRFLFDMQNLGNKLTMNSTFVINRTTYSSQEYHFLKELYNRVVAAQQSPVVLEKK